MKRRTSHISSLHATGRTAVMASLAFFVTSFSLYVYFLSASIVNVVMRQEIDHSIRTAEARTTELESRYVSAKSRITPRSALERGFVGAPEKTFVSKQNANIVLSKNDES